MTICSRQVASEVHYVVIRVGFDRGYETNRIMNFWKLQNIFGVTVKVLKSNKRLIVKGQIALQLHDGEVFEGWSNMFKTGS